MKKLESLNSPKYSLTPEKMGELVGGQQILQSTGRGSLNGVEVSCDLVRYANKTDQRHGIESGPTYGFSGKNDTAALADKINELQKK